MKPDPCKDDPPIHLFFEINPFEILPPPFPGAILTPGGFYMCPPLTKEDLQNENH